MNSLIFLDIDGVLNDHTKTPSGYCGIKSECVDHLNRITDETGARLVISSAWRYLVSCGEMTIRGFESMLRTHGVKGEVVGKTRTDIMIAGPDGEKIPAPNQRGLQIYEWLILNYGCEPFPRYLVLDDIDLGISSSGHPFILVDGLFGLLKEDADDAIAILKGDQT